MSEDEKTTTPTRKPAFIDIMSQARWSDSCRGEVPRDGCHRVDQKTETSLTVAHHNDSCQMRTGAP